MGNLLQAAMRGESQAQFEAGEIWRYFGNVLELSVYWYRRAAKQGHREAALRLAVLLADHGRSLYDPEEAFYWCTRALILGSSEARLLYPRMRRRLPEGAVLRVKQRVLAKS